jgi:tetratricopeptide (TPR) repeat protein
MKIKIFLASSKELEKERLVFADLVGHLNNALESRDISISLVKWEYVDASMGPEHKQEEYNKLLKDCDLCIVLYWTSFGKWTKIELDTAYKEKCAGRNPKKLYVYFKDGEGISEELQRFRDGFPDNYGHFFSEYKNIDTLKAHFLLQFMDYLSLTYQGRSIVEVKNGKVTIDGKEYVDLQNVPFAGNNKEYKDKLRAYKFIKTSLSKMDSDDPDYKEFQEEFRTLQKEIQQMEEGLWDTALMITNLSNTRSSERLKRAADLFEKGDNKGARAVLDEDEIAHDIQHHMNLVRLGEEGKAGLMIDIDELYLKLKLLKTADFKYQDEKYGQTESVFKRILDCTIVLYGKYSEETLRTLLRSRFYMFEQPKRYIPYLDDAIFISKKVFGISSESTTSILNTLIRANKKQGNKNRVVELYKEYLPVIIEKTGENSKDHLSWLSQLGKYYANEKDVSEAEHIFKKCIELCQNTNNIEGLANAYFNMADLCLLNKDSHGAKRYYDMYISITTVESDREKLLKENLLIARYLANKNKLAEVYFLQALEIARELNDDEQTAYIYEDISTIKSRIDDVNSEISYLEKALRLCPNEIKFRILTKLANRYNDLGDYNNAMNFAKRSLEYIQYGKLKEDVLKISYFSLLSRISRRFNDLEKADYYGKLGLECALEKQILRDVYKFYRILGHVSCRMGDFTQALNYYNSALEYKGKDTSLHTKTEFLSLIGWVYFAIGDNKSAERVYYDAISVYEDERLHLEWATPFEKDRNSRGLARTFANICRFYIWTDQFEKAQDALSKSFDYSTSKGIGLMDRDLLQARIYLGKKMFEETKKQLESTKPSIPILYQWKSIMAELYIDWGKEKEALEWTNQLLIDFADDPYVYELSGKYYAKFGDYENSLKQYETGLKMLIETKSSQLAIDRFKSEIEEIRYRT